MKLKSLVRFVGVLAAMAGLAASTQAQYINGDQYLDNVTPTGPYNGWSGSTVTVGATGIEVVNPTSAGYGGEYFSINSPVLISNPDATSLQLTLTVNGDPTPYIWFSPGQLVINDSSSIYYYNEPYNGYGNVGNPANAVWNGNTVTCTLPLQFLEQNAIQNGGVWVYGFNLDLDPAVINTGTGSFDVTYNSIAIVPTIPEPGTLMLVGCGAALLGLLGLRRRQSS
ncbi:MAG TPA: PEP-CTERM sorting domain-containing protein [Verrucomicrobiae bacterium]|nr:PEP-CTERM sorting domain-containing protein [Verrucomicrobiae bacterium]